MLGAPCVFATLRRQVLVIIYFSAPSASPLNAAHAVCPWYFTTPVHRWRPDADECPTSTFQSGGERRRDELVTSRDRSLADCWQWWRQWRRRRRTGCCWCRSHTSGDSRPPSSCSCSSLRTAPGCTPQLPRNSACLHPTRWGVCWCRQTRWSHTTAEIVNILFMFAAFQDKRSYHAVRSLLDKPKLHCDDNSRLTWKQSNTIISSIWIFSKSLLANAPQKNFVSNSAPVMHANAPHVVKYPPPYTTTA